MIKKLLISFVSLFLFGCSTYMKQVVYKPAPATYQEWSKYGASTLNIKKSLLECDKPAPDVSFEIYEKACNISRYDELAYMNKLVSENICMERAGYKYNGINDTKKICLLEKYKNLPACQPDAVIPTPSVERRLNSWYCKVKTDYNYCLKHSLGPQFCTPEETKTPPPECLADGQVPSPTDSAIQSERKSSTYVAPKGSSLIKEWIHMFGKAPTVHSCYGGASDECKDWYGPATTIIVPANTPASGILK